MMVPMVILDVDGVLTDFHEVARRVILREFGYDFPISAYTEWDVTSVLKTKLEVDHMNSIIAMPGFATALPPDMDAVAGVRALRESGADILFATSPHPDSPTWKEERETWLICHFGAAKNEIAHIEKKYFLGGDVFIDDKPYHVDRWSSRNPEGSGFLWRRPYNEKSGIPAVASWASVLEISLP